MIKPEGKASTKISAMALPPFYVYCDMETDGGGWTVFQRRVNGSQDFYLDWNDYVQGFGDLNVEFWLGLSKIHRLTRISTNLRIDLADFDGDIRVAKYQFQVGDSDSKYTLTVSAYSGNAGDSLTYHNGRPFSTKDRDNDGNSKGHCAQQFKGAWWYKSCHTSNLNGLYLSGNHASFANGVNWKGWKGYHYSLKVSEMKVRRV